jgi:hypothetical protein
MEKRLENVNAEASSNRPRSRKGKLEKFSNKTTSQGFKPPYPPKLQQFWVAAYGICIGPGLVLQPLVGIGKFTQELRKKERKKERKKKLSLRAAHIIKPHCHM